MAARELAEGTSVRLGWREGDGHWFDAALRRSGRSDIAAHRVPRSCVEPIFGRRTHEARAIPGSPSPLAALAALTLRRRCAAGAAEVSFYYPVAVGGPITKIIDGMAADFEKENPGIKVKPIYSGTYQETHRQGAHRA